MVTPMRMYVQVQRFMGKVNRFMVYVYVRTNICGELIDLACPPQISNFCLSPLGIYVRLMAE